MVFEKTLSILSLSIFTAVRSAARCFGLGSRNTSCGNPAERQHVPSLSASPSNLRPTTMEANATGAGTSRLSAAPCAPKTCHLAILSLHAKVTPGFPNASRSDRSVTHPGAGAGSLVTSTTEPLRIARRDDARAEVYTPSSWRRRTASSRNASA